MLSSYVTWIVFYYNYSKTLSNYRKLIFDGVARFKKYSVLHLFCLFVGSISQILCDLDSALL